MYCGVRAFVTLGGSLEDAETKPFRMLRESCIFATLTRGSITSKSVPQIPTSIVGVALKTRQTFIHFDFN